MESDSCKVLSIQSHVVSGYVGNKSACFPLQVLGFNVDMINSVQLSNHTGYQHYKGQVLDSDDLKTLMMGLKLNDLTDYSHVLTGYIGSPSFISEVINVVKGFKKQNPNVYFVCDPVLGDNGEWYVPKENLPLYRDELVPIADLITPNQFEIELLTDIKVRCESDAVRAIDVLHSRGTETVVISSCKFSDEKVLTLFGSSRKDGQQTLVKMEIPELEIDFLGTGDLFAAIMLAWMSKTGGNLKVSCEKAVNTIQSVLNRTVTYAKANCGSDGKLTHKLIELRLIQSKADIEDPETVIPAVVMTS